MRECLRLAAGMVIFGGVLCAQPGAPQPEKTGKQLYEAACAACHAGNGRGNPVTTVGFDTPLPDFTACRFVSREPDEDWMAVIHNGGPARSFDRMMPAFRDALTRTDLEKILGHVRTFCRDDSWPRGELNLPRPLVTEKAYPEDEAVLTVTAAAEGPSEFDQKLVYEKRFGARNQIEIIFPFGFVEQTPGKWRGGVGDLAVGFKRDLFHSFNKGSIFSLGGEVALPTADRKKGIGSGATIFEPFVAFGQLLPGSGFIQFHGGFELPADRNRTDEAFWRTAIGKSYLQGGYGRSWAPMVEILGARDLASGEQTHWDIVPQLQVSLSNKQHVLLNAGVRVPVNERARTMQIMVYLLWDWFDGGLLSGWR